LKAQVSPTDLNSFAGDAADSDLRGSGLSVADSVRAPSEDTVRRRTQHLALNLMSLGAPLIGAVVSIPILLRHLTPEGFSLLGLYWVIIGYSNLFELGMGRSVTRQLSRADAKGEAHSRSAIGTGLLIGLFFGLAAGVLSWMILPLVFGHFIRVPAALAVENHRAIIYIGLCVPALVLTSILTGVLEAWQRFATIASVRVPAGLALFVVPAILASHGVGLGGLMLGIVAVRIALVALLVILIEVQLPGSVLRPRLDRAVSRDLATFGGWLSLSALIGPLLVYMDRFILSWAQGLAATAVYTPPFEAVVRFLVIPSAVVGVIFPRMVAATHGTRRDERNLWLEANGYVCALVLPITLIFVFAGRLVFQLWLGSSGVGEQEIRTIAHLAAILAGGLLINALAHIPQAHIQAHGLARWTALLHVAELTCYLIYAPFFILRFGLVGAAWSWLIRSSLSALALYFLSLKLLNSVGRDAKL
jgi:O-antigen/teichoic acid export membrane protein